MPRTAYSLTFVFVSLLGAGNSSTRAHFVGGTLAGIPANADARVDLTNPEALSFECGKTSVRIPYQRINTLEYGQSVSRRYAAAILISPVLLLSKARKHYVTVGYRDEHDRQQALVFRVGKGEIRPLLASLEARSGRKVEYTDDEARKSGKG